MNFAVWMVCSLHDVEQRRTSVSIARNETWNGRFRNFGLPDFWISFCRPPFEEEWWSLSGSNRRPQACKASALPTELRPRSLSRARHALEELVGLGRLELPTSRLSSARSNQLSYKPNACSLEYRSRFRSGLSRRRKRNEDGGVPLITGR